jgi:hypothetical protein
MDLDRQTCTQKKTRNDHIAPALHPEPDCAGSVVMVTNNNGERRNDQSCDSVVQHGRFVAPACEVAGRWSKARHVLRLGRMPLRKMRRNGTERTGNRMDMGKGGAADRHAVSSGAVQVASGSGRVSTAHDTATRVPFRPWLISEFLFRSIFIFESPESISVAGFEGSFRAVSGRVSTMCCILYYRV